VKDPKAVRWYCLLLAIALAIIFAVCRGNVRLFLLTLGLTALLVTAALMSAAIEASVLTVVIYLPLIWLSRLFRRGQGRGFSGENGDENGRRGLD
jgi:hypothetical protein